jgi:hypothetical protein
LYFKSFYDLNIKFALNGVVKCFANYRSNGLFGQGYGIAMFVIPVITFGRNYFNNADPRIILTLGKPGFEDGLPQFVNLAPVVNNFGNAINIQEV